MLKRKTEQFLVVKTEVQEFAIGLSGFIKGHCKGKTCIPFHKKFNEKFKL